jgi:hypothetical protein
MGSVRLRPVTFAHWFEAQFIIMPNFPAWRCNWCGACEYDGEALQQLAAMLGPEAALRRSAGRRVRGQARRPQASPRLPGLPSV